MKTLSLRRLSACAGVPLGLALSLSGCFSHGPQTIGDQLGKTVEQTPPPPASLPRNPDPMRDKAIAGYQAYLRNAPPDATRDSVARRLADMLIEVNENRENAGQAANKQEYEQAAQIYQDLLTRHPNNAENDYLLYQLARAQSDLGENQAAIATWARLAQQYPDSPLTAEVNFRRAENLFSAGEFAAASTAYGNTLEKATQGHASPMVIQSLYKRGWALWREDQYDQAIENFLKVLDLVLPKNTQSMTDLAKLPGAKRKQAEDTLHALALSFASTGQAKPIDQFFSQQHPERPYQPLLYEALAQFYIDKERYTDAANTYQAFAEHYPSHPKAPLFSARVIDVYERAHFGNQALAAREAYVRRYVPKSDYWQGKKPDPQVQAKVKEYLLFVIQYYHAQSQSKQQAQAQLGAQQAENWYGVFLDNYPNDTQTPHINFLLAELRYDEGKYQDAARTYERTAYEYPANQDGAPAAYVAVQAWEQALQKADANNRDAIRKSLINSAQRYAQRYPQQPQVAAVLLRAAEESFAMKDLAGTRRLALQVYQKAPNDPAMQAKAKGLEADAAYAAQDYAAAEQAYAQAKAALARQGATPARDKALAAVNERLGDAVYKQGEQAREHGDVAAAAANFARVSEVSPESKAAGPAKYDAATALIQAGKANEAIPLLEQFKRSYPNDRLIPELDRKLAALYVQTNQPAKAAAEYAVIAERPQESADVRREALWQAATLYQKVGDQRAATEAFEHYVQRYPQPFDLAMEARQNLLMLAQKAGDNRQADYWRQQIIEADRNAGPARTVRSRTLAAQASLQLAQPIIQEYRQVKLVAPLKRSLEQKRHLLEQAMSRLQQAADYQIAEVSTQAIYQMGTLYQELSQALLDSQRPADLDADALAEYNAMLEDQAYGFEEKAIEIFTINADRANHGVQDKWVKASMDQLTKLYPARYAKSERHADVIEKLR